MPYETDVEMFTIKSAREREGELGVKFNRQHKSRFQFGTLLLYSTEHQSLIQTQKVRITSQSTKKV